MDFNDVVLFDDKTAADVFKEIHTNSSTKQIQIEQFLTQVSGLLDNATDAIMILPLMKDFLGVSVKNDETLLKMMATVQRFVTPSKVPNGDESGLFLTSDEKEELLNLEDDITIDEEEVQKIENQMEELMEQDINELK